MTLSSPGFPDDGEPMLLKPNYITNAVLTLGLSRELPT